jgi:hypothetical protein
MHAIFSVMLGIDQRESLPHLKSALRGIFKRVYKEVKSMRGALQQLQGVTAKDIEEQRRTVSVN